MRCSNLSCPLFELIDIAKIPLLAAYTYKPSIQDNSESQRLRLEMCMKDAEPFVTLHLSSNIICINQIDKNYYKGLMQRIMRSVSLLRTHFTGRNISSRITKGKPSQIVLKFRCNFKTNFCRVVLGFPSNSDRGSIISNCFFL